MNEPDVGFANLKPQEPVLEPPPSPPPPQPPPPPKPRIRLNRPPPPARARPPPPPKMAPVFMAKSPRVEKPRKLPLPDRQRVAIKPAPMYPYKSSPMLRSVGKFSSQLDPHALSEWQYRSLRDHHPAHPLTRRAQMARTGPHAIAMQCAALAPLARGASAAPSSSSLSTPAAGGGVRPTTAPSGCGGRAEAEASHALPDRRSVPGAMTVQRAPVANVVEKLLQEGTAGGGVSSGGGTSGGGALVMRHVSSAPALRQLGAEPTLWEEEAGPSCGGESTAHGTGAPAHARAPLHLRRSAFGDSVERLSVSSAPWPPPTQARLARPQGA